MGSCPLGPEEQQAVEQILGYLNFSAGTTDPKLLLNLDVLWRSDASIAEIPCWQAIGELLKGQLVELQAASSTFQDAAQASAVLHLVWDVVLPGYLEFHRDLLFHQQSADIFNSFFVGRVCEAVLAQGAPWEEAERVTKGAIRQLNDYLGYRPVAVLEAKKIEPYPHERVRPVPLFVRDAGVAAGRYHDVVAGALRLIEQTDDDLLQAACFDLESLNELAFDPRAYDFEHPVNKRPNYHFGQWDPHCIDNQGRYTRFVLQQVTMNAVMARLEGEDLPIDELQVEAAAVLAGIILMSSGISGGGPDAHDSMTTLANLMPRIAGYRDAFYTRLLSRISGTHGARLAEEAVERRQPFGAARQDLNAQLARCRASQLEHVQLARIFARLGYSEAAEQEANIVPTPSARMFCQIDCRMTSAQLAITRQAPDQAADLLDEIVEILHRGIDCGAIVDPWNILGFDAQFSLFPAIESSVHDHRVEELILLMDEMFGLYAHAWSEASAQDQSDLCTRLSADFRKLAEWWRQFAAHEVSSVEAIDALDAYHAAEHVAGALNLWHKEGAASGDIGFWAPHAQLFDSPQAYALVIEALLDRSDHVAAMGLLVHWLSEADRIPLAQGGTSFHRLAERWLAELCRDDIPGTSEDGVATLPAENWKLIGKFFDYIEANAETYWGHPAFQLADGNGKTPPPAENLDDLFAGDHAPAEDDEDLFGAAYEDVVFRDSADDGVDGEIFDSSDSTEDELIHESQRIADRLAFHNTLARLWKNAALHRLQQPAENEVSNQRLATLSRAVRKLDGTHAGLLELLDQVQAYRIPEPRGDHDSMVEFDRRRTARDGLLERVIATTIETVDASRLVQAVLAAEMGDEETCADAAAATEESLSVAIFAAILRDDVAAVSQHVTALFGFLAEQPLLYVPQSKGGCPRKIVDARIRQQTLHDLARCLPRLGLFGESFRLLESAREMERNNPVGAGAVTEFDELFKIGYKALVQSLVDSAAAWPEEQRPDKRPTTRSDSPLVASLEQLTQACLNSWLAHSQTLRLSVLEKVSDKRSWERLVKFIQDYGRDVFTQRFLNFANLRSILHRGIDAWLTDVQEQYDDGLGLRLFEDLDGPLSRREAVHQLSLIFEAIVENYGEYRDYNNTTTQSDRGELLYTFLDFLRLRTRYDKVCWNLKPAVLAHQILVRNGCRHAAQLWRRALRERVANEADKFVERFKKLQKKYAMQMPSIADRIEERFMRPLIIDRLCALVEPAADEAQQDGAQPTFRMLHYETDFLTREPSGVGFDLPPWLAALEDEVQRVALPHYERDDYEPLEHAVPQHRLSRKDIMHRLDQWTPT